MADLSDVTNTLVSLANAVIYPNGTSSPSAAGIAVTLEPGWPLPAQLDAIIAAGNAMLTVFPMPGMDKNTTRFPEIMSAPGAVPAPQISLSVASNTVTVGGTILPGEAATLHINYQAYSHGVIAGDTTASIAASLAGQIPGASVVGSVITFSSVFDIVARVSVPVLVQAELARQSRVFMLAFWCPSPTVRDALVPLVDKAFKKMPRIVLPDNTYARMIYRGTLELDDVQKQRIYRRDLRFEIEYVTSDTETDNTVTNFNTTVTPTGGQTKNINI